MEQLNSLPIEGNTFLIDMGILTASVFLANEVGDLKKSTKYGISKWMHIIQGQADLYICSPREMHAFTSHKCVKVFESHSRPHKKGIGQQWESRQGRSGMSKDLDPRNKGNPTKKVQAGNMVVKEPPSTASGFSLKPELKISSAAVEAENHIPKVTGKREERGAQE
jgi:hypothetical protein